MCLLSWLHYSNVCTSRVFSFFFFLSVFLVQHPVSKSYMPARHSYYSFVNSATSRSRRCFSSTMITPRIMPSVCIHLTTLVQFSQCFMIKGFLMKAEFLAVHLSVFFYFPLNFSTSCNKHVAPCLAQFHYLTKFGKQPWSCLDNKH